MDEVITPDLASLVYRHLRELVIHEVAPTVAEKNVASPEIVHRPIGAKPESGSDASKGSQEHVEEIIGLADLQLAYEHRTLYIIGKEEMSVKKGTAIWRFILLRMFLFLREYSRTKMANLKVPTDRLVEIGFIKEV